jgi:serine/threonine-protein kinase
VIGTTLAHYRITAELGAGGMGEVWKAEDTKLGREVALKVLPEEFAKDPERMARFEREAKVLASLNHPNIATLYGLETVASGTETGTETGTGQTTFLAMELVEGEDLSERIARGPIPIDEAIPIASPSTRRSRSRCRSPRRWRRRTSRGSSTAISNLPTSSSGRTAR